MVDQPLGADGLVQEGGPFGLEEGEVAEGGACAGESGVPAGVPGGAGGGRSPARALSVPLFVPPARFSLCR